MQKTTRKFDPPFFGINPKAYLFGKEVLELAKFADNICEKYNARIIFQAQYVDIPIIARETRNIFIFAQHMDSLRIGRGMGSVLPEALKAAGADGVVLNHVEKRISYEEIKKCVSRTKEVGLMSFVCADTIEDGELYAKLSPNMIVIESPEMIGGESIRNEKEYGQIRNIDQRIHTINPEIIMFHGAGIRNAQDIYNVVSAGAIGTGSTSALMLADDRNLLLEEMLRSVQKAWEEREKVEKK